MQLGCTKKTQEFLQKEISAVDPTINPLFSWSAVFSLIHRRKTLLILNDACRCGFVLYGVNGKEQKNLSLHIQEGIRRMMYSLGIAPTLIERYLEDCGSEITYTKTKDRKITARLTSILLYVKDLYDSWLNGELYQSGIDYHINHYLFSESGTYTCGGSLFAEKIAAYYKIENPYECPMAVLNISLPDIRSTRQVQVPAFYTLEQLHNTIQKVFCWRNYHLYDFMSENHESLDIMFPQYARFAKEDEYGTDTSEIQSRISIKEAFEKEPCITYLYDFGDEWEHKITLVKFRSENSPACCTCLLASGEAPPEDVGGVEGFMEFCEIMKNPNHPRYQSTYNWSLVQMWRPMDINRINQSLNF